LLFATFAVSFAHVKLYYDTIQMPIRNALTPTTDGQFSVDSNGCGGANTFGSNGVTTVVAGQTILLHFNYGTQPSGDHANAMNMFWAAFTDLNAPGQTQQSMWNAANQLAGPLPAPGGSTLTGYMLTINVPHVNTTQGIMSIYDQNHWGGCVDVIVVSSLNASQSATFPVGWVPQSELAGFNIGTCNGEYTWYNVTAGPNALASTTGQSYCCPTAATACGGRCWIGDAPKSMSGVQLFADGTLCSGNTICNGTQSLAYCSYTFNNIAASKCTATCSLCNSLCQTSASSGYANCACVGSDAVAHTLAAFAMLIAIIVAVI